jgi:hypothetical protein
LNASIRTVATLEEPLLKQALSFSIIAFTAGFGAASCSDALVRQLG